MMVKKNHLIKKLSFLSLSVVCIWKRHENISLIQHKKLAMNFSDFCFPVSIQVVFGSVDELYKAGL